MLSGRKSYKPEAGVRNSPGTQLKIRISYPARSKLMCDKDSLMKDPILERKQGNLRKNYHDNFDNFLVFFLE